MYHVFRRVIFAMVVLILLNLGTGGCATYPKKSLLQYDYPYPAYDYPCPPYAYPCGPSYGPYSAYSPYTPTYNPYYYPY